MTAKELIEKVKEIEGRGVLECVGGPLDGCRITDPNPHARVWSNGIPWVAAILSLLSSPLVLDIMSVFI